MKFPLAVAYYNKKWAFEEERSFSAEGHDWVATAENGHLVLSRQLSSDQKMSVLFTDAAQGFLRTVRGYIDLDGAPLGDFINTKDIQLVNLRTIIEVEGLAVANLFLTDAKEREEDAKKINALATAAAIEKARDAH